MDLDQTCIVCCDKIEYFAVGKCNHHVVCHLCALRLRALYKNNACSFCKLELPQIVILKSGETQYQDINRKSLPFDRKFGIYYESQQLLQQCQQLLKFNCPDCSESHSNIYELKKHIRTSHTGYSLCNICVANRKLFFHEHKLYTQQQLQTHNFEGDSNDTSFNGHPQCKFCRQYFYGKDELYEHLELSHEHCHICRKNGNFTQYYPNYYYLEQHFRQDHYLCEDPECRQNAFVVFSHEIDLKAHHIEVHLGDKKLSRSHHKQLTQIEVGFSYPSRREEFQQKRVTKRQQKDQQKIEESQSSSTQETDVQSFPLLTSNDDLSPQPQQESTPKKPRSDIKQRAPTGFGQLTKTISTDESSIRGGLSSSSSSSNPIENSKGKDQDILKKLKDVFSGDENKFENFRKLSKDFRHGKISSATYYEQYIEMLGKKNGELLFDEIVTLIPDAQKKKDLLASKKEHKSKIILTNAASSSQSSSPLELENHFPSLPSHSWSKRRDPITFPNSSNFANQFPPLSTTSSSSSPTSLPSSWRNPTTSESVEPKKKKGKGRVLISFG